MENSNSVFFKIAVQSGPNMVKATQISIFQVIWGSRVLFWELKPNTVGAYLHALLCAYMEGLKPRGRRIMTDPGGTEQSRNQEQLSQSKVSPLQSS